MFKGYFKVVCVSIIFNFHFSIFNSASAQRVIADDWQHLAVEFSVEDVRVGKTTLGGETFSTLAIEDYQQSSANYGNPSLPTFSRLIEVPVGAEFDVKVTDAVYDTLSPLQYRLMPVQLPRSKSDTTALKLCLNDATYQLNDFIGQPEASVEAVGIARDRRLARLQFSPVRYNPVSGQVIVCRHATVEVLYRHGDEQASKAMFERYYSPAFNSGANPLNNLYPKAVRTTAPVRYVIVANSMFRGHLDTFVQWKQKKGFITDIVYTDNPAVGTDTTSISNYLKGLYNNATAANPAPTYVLLVGDVAQLPAFSSHLTSPNNNHVTDLYYSTWTSGDHLPDCHYGRFSAQTVAQLTPQVQKTLMYEQYTFADPSFLDRAVMVAGVDGGTAGDYGYTHADPTMDYAVTNYVNGTHGWSQVMYFKNDVSVIPSCTTNVTIGSSASSNSTTVRSYYNQGAGFINYSAHGGSTGWGTPSFNNTHVSQMTNNQKFGLMIGNCCLTNKFEESTCFGEALLRKSEYAGAVGYIGGSNSTYWGQDFYWAVGIRSSIGPTMSMAYNASNLGVYDRTFHTHGESYAIWCTTQGSMVMQGNMAVENSSSGWSMKWYYWEIYHLMGDPSVMPYMTQANVMSLAASSIVNYGSTTLPVLAAPYAYVALTDTVNGILIASAYADATGSVVLSLPIDLQVGDYLLAASAQQYRTAFQTISVIQPTGPFPMVTNISSAPFNAGDTVALSLHVENPGDAMARNISIQLASSNPSVTLSATTVALDSLAAGASIDLTAAVSAYVAEDAIDNSSVDLGTSTSWTGSTLPAASTLRRTILAPVLTFSFTPSNPSLLPGSTTTVTATLRNSGHAATRMNSLAVTSPTSLFTVTSTPYNASMAVGSQHTVTLTLHADAQTPQSIHVPVSCHFGPFSGELPVYIGPSFTETFEGGTTHLSGWNPPASYPWVASTESPYEGSYCLRSALNLESDQQSEMNYNITVATPDSVSFYYRVSSENNYDKFFFLIDNVEMFNASGEVAWTRASYPLGVGNHVLTFRYEKDYSVSDGSDCAWIDNVTVPHQASNAVFIHRDTCIASTVPADSVDGVTIQTTGNTITITEYVSHPFYDETEEIVACDSYTWQGTEYTTTTLIGEALTTAYGCDSIIGLLITINHSSVGDTLFVTTQADSYEWNGTVYETSGTYQQTLTNSVGCDSLAILVLTIGTQGIDDFSILNSQFSVYPNPATYQVTVSGLPEGSAIELFDLTGRVVYTNALTQSIDTAITIDVNNLTSGAYLLRITTSEGSITRRIVKQ